MNAIGLTILRKGEDVQSMHLEAAPHGVLWLSNDEYRVKIQVGPYGKLLACEVVMLPYLEAKPAFASVVLAVGPMQEALCE